jgi:hypothetical protein
MGSREKTINQQVFESDVMASTPTFLKTDATGIDCYSFVVRQNKDNGCRRKQQLSWTSRNSKMS